MYIQPYLRKAVDEAFINLASGDPMTSVDSNLTDEQLKAMLEEAGSLPHISFRRIKDPTAQWINTTRATLFPRDNTNWPGHIAGRMSLPRSEKWLPHCHRFCLHLSKIVRQVACERALSNSIDSLREWKPNRIGINYMKGTPWDPAEIREHTDPVEEVGLVTALEMLGNSAGRLSFIFSSDICRGLGLTQPVHSVMSEETRISLTLAELRKPAQD